MIYQNAYKLIVFINKKNKNFKKRLKDFLSIVIIQQGNKQQI